MEYKFQEIFNTCFNNTFDQSTKIIKIEDNVGIIKHNNIYVEVWFARGELSSIIKYKNSECALEEFLYFVFNMKDGIYIFSADPENLLHFIDKTFQILKTKVFIFDSLDQFKEKFKLKRAENIKDIARQDLERENQNSKLGM